MSHPAGVLCTTTIITSFDKHFPLSQSKANVELFLQELVHWLQAGATDSAGWATFKESLPFRKLFEFADQVPKWTKLIEDNVFRSQRCTSFRVEDNKLLGVGGPHGETLICKIGDEIIWQYLKPEHVREGGFFALMSNLSAVDDTASVETIFKNRPSNIFHTVVGMVDGKAVATATLLREVKFIHGGVPAGHVEDVVVSEKYRGCGLGLKVVYVLLDISKRIGCYKVELTCFPKLVPFYSKHGFKQNAVRMRTNPPH